MTLVTPDPKTADMAELLDTYQHKIRDLRAAVDDLSALATDGEEVDLTLAQKLLSPSESLIRSCMKLETTLALHQQKDLGIAQAGHAVDLKQARFEIGCRLARLRACCAAG